MRAHLLPSGQISVSNDAISLDNTSKLDLKNSVKSVTKFIKTIGANSNAQIHSVVLTKQVKFISNISGNHITLQNTDERGILVKIRDRTTVSAPTNWDKTISPPKTVSAKGIAPSGFVTPTSSIQIGSSDVVLVFDLPVTITLNGTTGKTAYKLSGTTEWVLIDRCSGTFSSPTDPSNPNECSINDGVRTKILTYHFTEFAKISKSTTSTTSTTSTPTSSSGGSGRTGVGPSGSSFTGRIDLDQPPTMIPMWISSVVVWWNDDKITDQEFKNVITYLLDQNIIPNNTLKPDVLSGDLTPSIKQLFVMWVNDNISEFIIMDIINNHRNAGIW